MPLKIYYLDDEPTLLEMFTDTFSGPGREILTFSDPAAAIAEIRKNPPDVFFIDYRLPNYTGDQIAHSLDPNLPKVLVTGDMQVKSTYKFDAVFEKPYRAGPIQVFLEKILQTKKVC